MNTGLSLVSEMLERRDRLKAQHLDALKKFKRPMMSQTLQIRPTIAGLKPALIWHCYTLSFCWIWRKGRACNGCS